MKAPGGCQGESYTFVNFASRSSTTRKKAEGREKEILGRRMGRKNGGKGGRKAAGKNKQKALKINRHWILKTVVTLLAQAAQGSGNTSGVRASSFKQHTFRDVFTRPALALSPLGTVPPTGSKEMIMKRKKKSAFLYFYCYWHLCAADCTTTSDH